MLAAGSLATPPLLLGGLFTLAGLLLGLWRRRTGAARLWRWLVLAATVGFAAPVVFTPVYGRVVALALLLAGVCGLAAAGRPARVWRR